MLSLLTCLTNGPSADLQFLHAHGVLLYYDVDTVLIFDSESLQLLKVLVFHEHFPAHRHPIQHLAVEPAMNLIFAASQNRIAVWTISRTVEGVSTRTHSSLVLPPSCTVSALSSASGLLAVGFDECLSVYTLIMENSLPVWSRKWCTEDIPTPSHLRLSPSLMSIASTTKEDTSLRLYSTTTGTESQMIPHPRPVISTAWRQSENTSRDDPTLYTITSDSTLRIFFPVVDEPRFFELHASLSCALQHPGSSPASSITPVDRSVLSTFLHSLAPSHDVNNGQHRSLQEIMEQGWDLFFRILYDGSILVAAVANIDRRPPTLLYQFTLQHTPPNAMHIGGPHACLPDYFHIIARKSNGALTLLASNPLAAYSLDLPNLIFPLDTSPQPSSLELIARLNAGSKFDHRELDDLQSSAIKLIRTPEGRGVAMISHKNMAAETWTFQASAGRPLTKTGSAKEVDLIVVLEKGRAFATYSNSCGTLSLHCTEPSYEDSECTSSTVEVPPLKALFVLPRGTQWDSSSPLEAAKTEMILGITTDHQIVIYSILISPHSCTLSFHSISSILHEDIITIVPVDPMAWSFKSYSGLPSSKPDVLLTINAAGELAFWIPYIAEAKTNWRCTGRVKTGRHAPRMATCSSAKKSALVVVMDGQEEELTIWDSHESAFSSGLEFRTGYGASTPINDLDWSATPDGQSILAIGFQHHVDLLCQQRKSYFNNDPDWAMCWRIDTTSITPLSIDDSVWLADGTLLVATGPQLFLYGQPKAADNVDTPLFEYVARQNGPLQDWHPQIILQCLLWNRVELVKEVIARLIEVVGTDLPFRPIDLEDYLTHDEQPSRHTGQQNKIKYGALFDSMGKKEEEEHGFSRKGVLGLLSRLETHPLPYLTPNEQAHLQALIQATLEIDEQRRSLDPNGLRYLISVRSFYILNQRAKSASSTPGDGNVVKSGKRERIRYRDMIWAYYSESQDLLLNEATRSCPGGKMLWSDARALGVPIWLSSVASLSTQLEVIARNEYMNDDARDPTACSLFYFALGKTKLLHGLWKQASWHKEQPLMLKFLANDFSEQRWKTAALKNAFALLGRRRFEYAAAFFLLGGSLKDAVGICIKHLNDFQLAVALARVVERGDDGPVLKDIITSAILPTAFKEGNRWLANWAFWSLHRRDLAVRVLLTPLKDVAASLEVPITEITETQFDDTSLALLFSQLRDKTLQAAKGASEITGATEWNFVLQIARIFCRMGCNVLALDLVKSWKFEPPQRRETPEPRPPTTKHVGHRPVFGMQSHIRRRSSMLIDIDVAALPSTGPPTPDIEKPDVAHPVTTVPEDGIAIAQPEAAPLPVKKTGIGNLMKSAKQDVTVPEFDMRAFF